MYGKAFEQMYEGSMYGAGAVVFAVWGYAISKAHKGCVELNVRKLADTLGASREDVTKAIEWLGRADPESRCKKEEGRRLVRQGEFQYFLPSWDDYNNIRNEDARRAYNAEMQAKYRAEEKQRKLKRSKPQAGEQPYDKIHREQGQEAADAWQDSQQQAALARELEPPPALQAEEIPMAKGMPDDGLPAGLN